MKENSKQTIKTDKQQDKTSQNKTKQNKTEDKTKKQEVRKDIQWKQENTMGRSCKVERGRGTEGKARYR